MGWHCQRHMAASLVSKESIQTSLRIRFRQQDFRLHQSLGHTCWAAGEENVRLWPHKDSKSFEQKSKANSNRRETGGSFTRARLGRQSQELNLLPNMLKEPNKDAKHKKQQNDSKSIATLEIVQALLPNRSTCPSNLPRIQLYLAKGQRPGQHGCSLWNEPHAPKRSRSSALRSFVSWKPLEALLAAMPGAPSSVLAPSSDALCY